MVLYKMGESLAQNMPFDELIESYNLEFSLVMSMMFLN